MQSSETVKRAWGLRAGRSGERPGRITGALGAPGLQAAGGSCLSPMVGEAVARGGLSESHCFSCSALIACSGPSQQQSRGDSTGIAPKSYLWAVPPAQLTHSSFLCHQGGHRESAASANQPLPPPPSTPRPWPLHPQTQTPSFTTAAARSLPAQRSRATHGPQPGLPSHPWTCTEDVHGAHGWF